jgi:hypothetical protein
MPQQISSTVLQKVESVKAPKKESKKKSYQKMTSELVDSVVLQKYPNFPEEYKSKVYTLDGGDIFVEFKNKKIEIKK